MPSPSPTTSVRRSAGITHILTMPWMFYTGPDATLAEKVDGMTKFRRDLALDSGL